MSYSDRTSTDSDSYLISRISKQSSDSLENQHTLNDLTNQKIIELELTTKSESNSVVPPVSKAELATHIVNSFVRRSSDIFTPSKLKSTQDIAIQTELIFLNRSDELIRRSGRLAVKKEQIKPEDLKRKLNTDYKNPKRIKTNDM